MRDKLQLYSEIKPGFPYDRPDRPSRFQEFKTIGATETIAGFHTIVSIASKTEDVICIIFAFIATLRV